MLLAVFFAMAMTTADLGPDIGAPIPARERIAPLMGPEGATLVFVRSVDWCPFCKRQVEELSSEAGAFAAEGRPLIFISYDAAETQEAFKQENGIDAAFIADERSSIIKAFGILNESHLPGSRVYGIPHPGIFIIDAEGVVKAKLYEADYATNTKSYQNRPAVERVLEAVRGAS